MTVTRNDERIYQLAPEPMTPRAVMGALKINLGSDGLSDEANEASNGVVCFVASRVLKGAAALDGAGVAAVVDDRASQRGGGGDEKNDHREEGIKLNEVCSTGE